MSTKKEKEMALAFIVSTDARKVDPKTRKLIRSHVMRGKNRVKNGSRKSRNIIPGNKPDDRSVIASEKPTTPSSVPRLLCSELSNVRFANDVEPERVADVMSFVSMFPKAMFQLNQCMTSDTDVTTKTWFAPLFFDPAYLYTMCFTVQTYFDGFLGRTRSDKARQRDNIYYAKAIRILQDRLTLNDDSVKLSDSTIMTVLAMSGHAYTIGDYDSAKNHINGLLQLVSMRGLGTLVRDTKVLIEIVRSDLSAAIDNDSKPMLFAQCNIPWPLIGATISPVNEDFSSSCHSTHSEVCGLLNELDSELAAVWYALGEFCSLVNKAAEKGAPKLTEETFLQSMASIMYRLLHQRFEKGSLEEALRLALIAFSSPIFLHWNRIELPDQQFNQDFQEALAALELQKGTSVAPEVWTWLLTVAALSMFYELDNLKWATSRLRRNVSLSKLWIWTDAQALLNSFLWIGMAYDKTGKDIFDSILPAVAVHV